MLRKAKKSPKSIDGIVRRQDRRSVDSADDMINAVGDEERDVKHYLDNLTQPSFQNNEIKGAPLPLSEDSDSERQDRAAKRAAKREQKQQIKAQKSQKKKQRSSFMKIFKRTALTSSALLLIVGGYFGFKLIQAQTSVFQDGGSGALSLLAGADPSQLNSEGDSRVNILLAGIGGEGHSGGDLTDTIIIASIDVASKEVAMLSIPRDMYVDIPGYWSTRINAANFMGIDSGFSEEGYPDGGMGLLQKTLEQTLDIEIDYYVRGDFEAFQQSVDTVGGVTVDVPEPLYDPNFTFAEGGPLNLAAGQQNLDGVEALKYVRSRKTSAEGDFARAERQREVLIALKDKVLSLGTLSNPLKVSGLIDAFSNNVSTNISPSEVLILRDLAGEISSDSVVSASLRTDEISYLTDQNIGGAAVLAPRTGDYLEIQEYVKTLFVDGFVKNEGASLIVLNASSTPGAAAARAEELRGLGYSVILVGNAQGQYDATTIIDRSNSDKEYTKRYLEQRFSTLSSPQELYPDEAVDINSDFVIIVADD